MRGYRRASKALGSLLVLWAAKAMVVREAAVKTAGAPWQGVDLVRES
jgi:uracil phosphoribosyltransferase